MNTDQLDRTIRLYAKHFDGVFSSDRLPTKPRLLVCNTDPSDESGEYWTAIYVDDDGHCGEYVDSLGHAPTHTFERYMDEHCRENYYRITENISRFCEHYYPRESFREGLCNHRRWFVCLFVCLSVCYHDN